MFDAVASNGGFTAAAADLGISQPAVSRHVAQLERQLGVTLVERATVTLTEPGRRLSDGVAAAFDAIERALDDVVDRRDALVVAVQPAMATTWVVPLLEPLEQVAGSPITLRVFDRASELADGEWDVAIVPGSGEWDGWQSVELFGEAVRPIASPSFAAEHGIDAETSPEDLARLPLLHVDSERRPSMTWPEWFAASGTDVRPPRPRIVYDHYSTVVQEALVGHGVALGWRHLVGDLVRRGLLVPVGPIVEHAGVGHHLCWRQGRH